MVVHEFMRSKQIQRSAARPWPSKVGLSEGVISLEIRCELDYLHGELYFLPQQSRLFMNLCVLNKHNGIRIRPLSSSIYLF